MRLLTGLAAKMRARERLMACVLDVLLVPVVLSLTANADMLVPIALMMALAGVLSWQLRPSGNAPAAYGRTAILRAGILAGSLSVFGTVFGLALMGEVGFSPFAFWMGYTALGLFAHLGLSALLGKSGPEPVPAPQTQDVDYSALLNRPHIPLDKTGIDQAYRGRSVLITGAGGTIGAELCRQILACEPKQLVMVDHSEAALYQIDRELRAKLANRLANECSPTIVPVLGSIVDRALIARTFRTYRPDIVFHAAAYKHVPLVEQNAIAAVNNNVIGTRVVAECARAEGVARFVLVSSDKALRPASVMGATKRLAELVVYGLQAKTTHTQLAVVRFGNVLGSSGSVIPLFEEQIAQGGPITITHPDATRYFMSLAEASHLLLRVGACPDASGIFALNMGEPVSIRDLALKLIHARGQSVQNADSPSLGIEITYTGLRPGEKLHEEPLLSEEFIATDTPQILRGHETGLSEIELASALRSTTRAVEARDADLARATLARFVPGFDAAAKPEHTQKAALTPLAMPL